MKYALFGPAVFCLNLVIAASVQAGEISRLVVFGDSLSDPGNYFQLFGEHRVQPFEAENVPSAPYAIGGQHFSNGPTWVEQLANSLGIAGSGSPASVAPGVFTNYAIGRSRARGELLETVFHAENLTSQVDRYLNDRVAPEDTLYVLWIGSNDVADSLGAYLGDQADMGNALITAGVHNTAAQMGRLYEAGARRFLVLNIPDLALTPRLIRLVTGACAQSMAPELCSQQLLAQVSMISAGYNGGLQFALLGFAQLPEVDIQFLDVSAFLTEVVEHAADYGFDITRRACITPGTRPGALCQHADSYLFWDGQHPTRHGHKVVADFALSHLASP